VQWTSSVHGAIYSSVTLGIILGLSSTVMMGIYGLTLVGALAVGALLLSRHPRTPGVAAVLLLLGFPLAFFGRGSEDFLLQSACEIMALGLCSSALIAHGTRQGVNRYGVVAAATLGSLLFLLLGIYLLDAVAVAWAALPLCGSLLLFDRIRDAQEPRARQIMGSHKPSSPPAPEGVARITVGIAFLAGALVPFGVASYNLVNMNLLPLVALIIPPTTVGLGLVSIALAWTQKGAGGDTHTSQGTLLLDRLSRPKTVVVGCLALATVGLVIAPFGTQAWLWIPLGGGIWAGLVLMLSGEMQRHLKPYNRGRAYVWWWCIMLALVLGSILNAIKGLLLLSMTFIDFVDGAFVIRTDFTTLPGLNLPVLTKVLYAGVCLLIGLGLLGGSALAKKHRRHA
jgi:hypothetical protein